MPIKLTVREAIDALRAIDSLPKLPSGKTAYHLGYIGGKLEPHSRAYDKMRQKLVIDLGELDEKDGRRVKGLKLEEFGQLTNEALDVEIEINREPLKLVDVLGTDEAKAPSIEPWIMRALQKIIVET